MAAIVDSADDAIISKNLDGIISSWNPAAERLFGYGADEIIGKSVLTIIPPERAAEEDMILGRVRRGERVEHFETVRLRKDGSRVAVSLTASPVKDARGRIIGASKIARDITERQRVEEALRAEQQMRKSVARLQLLSDTARDLIEVESPVAVLDRVYDRLHSAFDLEFYFHFEVEGGGAALRLRAARGVPSDVAQKVERLEFGEALCGIVARDLKPLVIADVQRSDDPRAEFIRSQGIGAYVCHPLVAGGQLFGTLSFGKFARGILSDDAAETVRVLSDMIATAMARRSAERALDLRIRQQRAVADLGLIALRSADLQELFDRATAQVAEILEVELCKVLELLPSGKEVLLRSGVGWQEGLVGKATVGTDRNSQAGYTLLSSHPVIVENLAEETRFSGPPLLRDHGVVSGLSCIIVGERNRPWGVLGAHSKSLRRFTKDDVSFLQAVANVLGSSIQRKSTEEELSEAHAKLARHARDLEGMVAERTVHLEQTIAELESVSYSLSHDMRAPLRTIRSFSEIVLEQAEERLGPESRDLLRKVIGSAGRLDHLIQDVLIYSRFSRDEFDLQTLDVEALLRQIMDERRELQAPHAEIIIQSPLAAIRAHEAYLTQCITNLLDNAVKFVPPDRTPQVRIWTDVQDGQVRLTSRTTARAFRKRRRRGSLASFNGFTMRRHTPEQALVSRSCAGQSNAWAGAPASRPRRVRAAVFGCNFCRESLNERTAPNPAH